MSHNSDCGNISTNKSVLTGNVDRFKGITIISTDDPSISKQELSERLSNSIEKWKIEVCLKIQNIVVSNKTFDFYVQVSLKPLMP